MVARTLESLIETGICGIPFQEALDIAGVDQDFALTEEGLNYLRENLRFTRPVYQGLKFFLLRERNHLSMNKSQMAKHLGINYNTYSHYEGGIRTPNEDNEEKLFSVLGYNNLINTSTLGKLYKKKVLGESIAKVKEVLTGQRDLLPQNQQFAYFLRFHAAKEELSERELESSSGLLVDNFRKILSGDEFISSDLQQLVISNFGYEELSPNSLNELYFADRLEDFMLSY